MKLIRNSACALLCLTSLPSFALSEQGQAQLQTLQERWAEINYQLPKAEREKAFASLSQQAQKAVAAEPKAAELHIWHGIILSTYAGAKGGLGALGLVKQAKASLEQGLALDPKALSGSAYTSLGSLYYQVPGWPIGFGDDEKAEAMLKQALAINPDGIDPNYFYGDYLARAKRFTEARAALEKALQAPPRPNRLSADAGRQEEIRALLNTVKAELE
ncbi:tetratricopeptide repeat protein [Pseudomonas xionganensis]|uniref:Tetratricopeptide repeat protein n=1 Tax=Pseudomonas xionganensis TaxID=2654845 RepID=A0A6I4KT19_9PSED|nr:tetratricopeptide repeat protein [Pseudomonas xionganensis]MVW74851.1 tetratricopeptide repeat protein [Pseudomonas xionganensis]